MVEQAPDSANTADHLIKKIKEAKEEPLEGGHEITQKIQGVVSGERVEDKNGVTSESQKLEERIQALEAEVKEKENKYLYLYAEFENFKKRAQKERQDLIKFAAEPVVRDLLQVVDNLERALAHVPVNTDKNIVQGLQMVLSQFCSTLEKQGVSKIVCLDKPFDPNFHEAVGQEDSKQPAGTITKEHLSGYTFHGRLLRPSRVMISSGRG